MILSDKLRAHLKAILTYVLDTEDDCYCEATADGSMCVKHHAEEAQKMLEGNLAQESGDVLLCDYVTVWDGGTEIRTPAKFYKSMNDVETEAVEVEGLDNCEREYLEFPDGTTLDRYNENGGEMFNV